MHHSNPARASHLPRVKNADIYDSLTQAKSTTSNGRQVEVLPLDRVKAILKQ